LNEMNRWHSAKLPSLLSLSCPLIGILSGYEPIKKSESQGVLAPGWRQNRRSLGSMLLAGHAPFGRFSGLNP